MNRYIVEITETSQRQVEVEASSRDEALRKVEESYNRCDIVFNETDFVDVEFDVIKEKKIHINQER